MKIVICAVHNKINEIISILINLLYDGAHRFGFVMTLIYKKKVNPEHQWNDRIESVLK